MFFEVERVERLLKDLDKLRFRDEIKMATFAYKEGKYKDFSSADYDGKWLPFHCGEDKWGDPDKRYWFTHTLEIPAHYEGKDIWFHLKTGQEDQWDLNKNPQFLLRVDDQIIQGFDINHTCARICSEGKTGRPFRIDLSAYSGFEPHHVEFIPSISVFDQKTDALYFHIKSVLEISRRLDVNDIRRIKALNKLNDAMNLVDFRAPYTPTYYASLQAAENYIDQHIYEPKDNGESYQASCVGHTHIDVAWLWDLEQTREKVVRSFSTVLNLMKDYPDYKFMSSQPQLYEFMKEEAPDLYEVIKEQVKKGNWEPEGAMWVEADCNLVSGESLIRQILFGTRFFRDEFGVENEILWLPDVFGYSQALPQILNQFNIKYFMTTKISWNEYNKMPFDTFMWKGMDGSEVLTHFVTATDFKEENEINTFTTYNGMIDANHVMGAWQRYQQKNINDDVLICYGYGDGGGGPTREMLETAKRMSQGIPGAPTVELTHSKPYFNRLEEKLKGQSRLPKWTGELYLEYHRGTYTSMAKSKRYNRKSEQLMHDLEFFYTMAEALTGFELYPQNEINKLWKLVLLNQFHDILPGTSIKKVYQDSFAQYETLEKKGHALLDKALSFIAANGGQKDELFVFNQLGMKRSDYIEVLLEDDFNTLIDDAGTYPIQKTGDGKGVVYLSDLPSYGFKAFALGHGHSFESPFKFENGVLETPYYTVTFHSSGVLTDIFDKQYNRSVLKGEGNVFQVFEDKPHHYDAWDINVYYKEKMWTVEDLIDLSVVEDGPLRFGVRIVKTYMASRIEQTIYFYHQSRRIDFKTTIDWHEQHALLKVAFPVNIHSERATYDIQFGHVERPTHQNTSWDFAKFEVVGHKWADLSEGNYGVSLLNDSKYGYDIQDNVMRLTLIKSATEPNPEADQGHHEFTYALLPHTSDKMDETIQAGYFLNNPVYTTMKSDGNKGCASASFVTVDQGNIVIDVIKKAEDCQGTIVRIHDQLNVRSSFKLTFMKKIKKAYACNLHEVKISDITYDDNIIDDLIKPFEIKTYYIEFEE